MSYQNNDGGEKKRYVLGKTLFSYLIVMPIICAGFLASAILLALSESGPEAFVSWGLSFILCALLVVFLLAPKNAVVYDGESQSLVIHSGKNLFAAFKTKIVPL
jgi:hypothetical protein